MAASLRAWSCSSVNASHAALCVARQGVASHADAVALVIECSIPDV